MFFLLRAAFCIGIVVAMLPDTGTPEIGTLASGARAAASAGVRRYCAQGAGCASLAASAATWLLAGTTGSIVERRPALPSIDTLEASDLLPAWREPNSRTSARSEPVDSPAR